MPLAGDDASSCAPIRQTIAVRGQKGRRADTVAYTASADRRSRSSLARRRAAILANMEMWRWEPRDMGERRIEVNIPDFSVDGLRRRHGGP